MKIHTYYTKLEWKDDNKGTVSYQSYDRNHTIKISGKPTLNLSADSAFMGNSNLHNPEDLLVASLASCHMLWYLHLCSRLGITVVEYEDHAEGVMLQEPNGGGHFESVTLKPKVSILEASQKSQAIKLHDLANEKCYIANSCNFPIRHQVKIKI